MKMVVSPSFFPLPDTTHLANTLADLLQDGLIIGLVGVGDLDFYSNAVQGPPERIFRGGVDHFRLVCLEVGFFLILLEIHFPFRL